jgi:hypothetical protein
MTGPATVTQANREGWREMKPIAEFDAAIARARIEGAKMALEAAAKVADQRAITQRALKRPEDWPEGAWNARQVGICNALELTATAIRQIDPAQIVKGQSDAE